MIHSGHAGKCPPSSRLHPSAARVSRAVTIVRPSPVTLALTLVAPGPPCAAFALVATTATTDAKARPIWILNANAMQIGKGAACEVAAVAIGGDRRGSTKQW